MKASVTRVDRFANPPSLRNWRSFGAFSAFLGALFTEM